MRKLVFVVVASAVVLGSSLTAGAAPDRQIASPARLAVSQTTRLVDGQTVRVRATGVTPGQDVRFLECFAACAHWTPTYATADARGRVDAVVRLARFIQPEPDEWPTTDPPTDCAYDGCSLAIVIPDYRTEWPDGYPKDISSTSLAQVPIDFARTVPVAPVVTTQPSGLLGLSTQLSLHGAGFTPGKESYAVRCLTVDGLHRLQCDTNYEARGTVDAQGQIELTIPVTRRWFDTDCLARGVACTVRVGDAGRRSTTIPLRFDPRIPLPPPPTLTATPTLVGGSAGRVHVHGERFVPGAQVAVSQCWDPDGRCGFFARVHADTSGRVDVDADTTRFSPVVFFSPVQDCARTRCYIRAAEEIDASGGGRSVQTSLRFARDPNLPTLRLGDAVASEGDTSNQQMKVAATIDHPVDHEVGFGWYGTGGYGLVFFPAGSTRAEMTFSWAGDTVAGSDRTLDGYLLILSGLQFDPRHAVAHVRVIDDD